MNPEIIAECGTAHGVADGRSIMSRAVDLVGRCAEAWVDTVKFQLFVPDEPLFCPMPGDENRWDRWADSMLTFNEWKWIKAECTLNGVNFLVSVFQHGGLKMAKDLGCTRIKVASRAAQSFPYRDWEGDFIISEGMCRPVHMRSPARVTTMQCCMEYPTPLVKARWQDGRQEVTDNSLGFGLSDHSGNPWIAIDAIARGCPMVEVHVDGMPGSVTFEQLKLICEARDNFMAMQA